MSFSPLSTTFFTHRVVFAVILAVLILVGTGVSQPACARDWQVPQQAPTIQAAIDSCVQGDVVVIDAGTYTDCTTLSENVYHIAVLKSGVSLRGATGDPADVILDAQGAGRCLEMRGLTGTIEVSDLTLRRGRAINPFGSGGGVFIYDSDPTFRSCVFDSNYADYAGGAMCVLYGGATIEDCVFIGNESATIGGALRLSSSPTTITGTTFHGTLGEAIHYRTDAPVLERVLITDGDDSAIVRNSDSDPLPEISCSDLHGNLEDWSDFFADLADSNDNLSVDPLYCNPLFGDLTLYITSLCAAENNSCGQIGALPAVCGAGADFMIVRADGTGDFPTIQSAINAAAPGDTVALADGTYLGNGNRDLDFLGKAITVKGLSGDPELAIIDCQGSVGEPHRGVYFHSNESSFSLLRDVTITNGDVPDDGAGALCESSPRIENCRFVLNHAERGAGVFCDGGSPEIVDCTFHRNEGRQRGGGIALFKSEASLSGCSFTENWGAMGSAVFLPDSSTVTIETSTMAHNNCSLDKGVIGVDGNSSLTLHRTIIAYGNNHAVRTYDLAEIFVTESDVFGNETSDWSIDIYSYRHQDGNISADPRFCDSAAGDLTLRSDSPCAANNAWLGEVIGAHPVACDAPPVFVDASSALGAAAAESRGVTWADIDADGNLDAFVSNSWANNEIYLGDGAGGFTPLNDEALGFPGSTYTGLWADWNHDGDLDLYMVNDILPNLLVDADAGAYSMITVNGLHQEGPAAGAAWLDVNRDGNLDLFIATTDTTSKLMVNNGQNQFAEDTAFRLLELPQMQQAAVGDFDFDGDPDLYLVTATGANQLIRNDGTDGFALKAAGDADHTGNGRSAAWGDYDNDEDLDLFLVNDGESPVLLRNRNSNTFDDETEGALKLAGPGRSGIWGDWDNDGDLDLFLTNCGAPDRLLRNEGDQLFVDAADAVFAAADSSTGAAFGDYDGDGDLDLLVGDRAGSTRLFRNDQNTGNHWLEVDLVHFNGTPGFPGARVRVVTGDTVQIREVGSSNGWLSQDATTVHFGLGSATAIDSLRVYLPSCVWAPLRDVAVDQRLVLVGTGASPVFEPDPDLPGVVRAGFQSAYPNPFNPATTIRFALTEAGPASMTVYDVAGRLVRTLFDEVRPGGIQQVIWAGRDQSNRSVASGVYYLRLRSKDVEDVRSVVLLK